MMSKEEFWQRAFLASLSNSGTRLAATKADESVEYFNRKFYGGRNKPPVSEVPQSPQLSNDDIPF